ncbi:MAG: hypothetical protein WBV85_13490 [Solirubrobacteraceae bacterium]
MRIRNFVVALCAMVALTSSVAGGASANELYPSVPSSTFGEQCSGSPCGPGQFDEPTGIAANSVSQSSAQQPQAGDVYVIDTGDQRVERFSSSGAYLSQWDGSATQDKAFDFSVQADPQGIAVDSSTDAADPSAGDVYVADAGHKVIDQFTGEGVFTGLEITGTCPKAGSCESSEAIPFAGTWQNVAVDTKGNLWVYECTEEFACYTSEFGPKGGFVKNFPNGGLAGPTTAFGVGTGLVYAGNSEYFGIELEAGEEVGTFGAGLVAIAVNQSSGEVLIDKRENIEDFVTAKGQAPTLSQTLVITGLSESHGLAVGAKGDAYATQRIADNVQVIAARTVPTPVTGSATSAGEAIETVEGMVDPEGQALTACSFDYAIYGTEAGVYPNSVPCRQSPAVIGTGTDAVTVTAEISGLQPGATYHYRLDTTNAGGSSHGFDSTFFAVKKTKSSLGLPDDRSYELVSTIPGTEVFVPEAGQGKSYEREVYSDRLANAGGFRASDSGGTIAFIGGLSPSGEGGFGVAKDYSGNLYLSSRSANGWRSADIDPVASGRNILGFSSDLAQQYLSISESHFNEQYGIGSPCSSQLYSRSSGIAGSFDELLPSCSSHGHLRIAGTSRDNSHILFQSSDALTPGASEGASGSSEQASDHTSEGNDNLYDSVAGQLHQVNILPDGDPEAGPEAIFGGRGRITENSFGHDLVGDISTDGSRIVWTSVKAGALYDRENDQRQQSNVEGGHCTEPEKACTVQMDLAESACVEKGHCESGGGQYWAANTDGSRVFFTDCHRLVEGATAVSTDGCEEEVSGEYSPIGADLYEYDFSTGRLTDLTIDRNQSDALGADVQGVMGASEDGSYVYFVADGVLSGRNAEGRGPVSGEPNVYVEHDGQTSVIATLQREDNDFLGSGELMVYPEDRAGDWRAEAGFRTAEVSANGQAVGFSSRLSLTGYDNYGILGTDETGTLSFGRQPEVFVYEVGTQRLACVSCTPTGAPPVRTAESWENEAGGHVGISGGLGLFDLRWLNQDGTQLYFESSQPLVARDTNDRQDVYEWHSDGTAGCTEITGCVALLSGGDAPGDAYFLDASASGSDVFFTTREQLAQQANGETTKLYDARVAGGFPESSLACTGAGCQGIPPAPPIFATPSSVTFAGVGNFPSVAPPVAKSKAKSTIGRAVKCRAGLVRKRGKCVRRRKKAAGKVRKGNRASLRRREN